MEKEKPLTKSRLAIVLSKLGVFENPKAKSEQYATDPEVAAEVIWQAYMIGDIKGKALADLGCGTGILGIAALLLGAKKVHFVDNDKASLQIAKKNLEKVRIITSGRAEFEDCDIEDFAKKVEVVVQNPPFGIKARHRDRVFLQKAFEIAPIVYSFHKSESAEFLKSFARDSRFDISNRRDFSFPLKRTQKYHKRDIFRIKVSAYRFMKQGPG